MFFFSFPRHSNFATQVAKVIKKRRNAKEWRKNIRKDDREEKSILMKQTNKTALIFRSKSTKKDFALKIAKMAHFHNLLKINAFLFLTFNIQAFHMPRSLCLHRRKPISTLYIAYIFMVRSLYLHRRKPMFASFFPIVCFAQTQ